jgi:hypothetical protein
MISPYKLSATQVIADFRLPISERPQRFFKSTIGNWQLLRSLMVFFEPSVFALR